MCGKNSAMAKTRLKNHAKDASERSEPSSRINGGIEDRTHIGCPECDAEPSRLGAVAHAAQAAQVMKMGRISRPIL